MSQLTFLLPASLGLLLKTLRLNAGLTPKAAAKEASLSASFINAIERGSRLPSLKTLKLLGEIYGVSFIILPQSPSVSFLPLL